MVTNLASLESLVEEGRQVFEKVFKMEPEMMAMAHGGLTILGEQTEYCQGFLMPIAIPMMTVIVGRKSNSRTVRVYTTAEEADPPRLVEFFAPIDQKPLDRGKPLWANYIKGVLQYFEGPKIGFDAVINSNIPMKRGMSSSSALEIAAYTFLEALCNIKTDSKVKSELCQRAEYIFALRECFLSEPLVSLKAEDGHALLTDCRSYECKHIPAKMKDAAFLVVAINKKEDFPKKFIEEKRQTFEALTKMNRKISFRDVTIEDMDNLNASGCIDQCTYMVARYILDENERVQKALEALHTQNHELLGSLLNECYDSLKEDYGMEMSAEMHKMVETARKITGVYGAKCVGGNYSACVLVLVNKSMMDSIIKKIKVQWSDDLEFYEIKPSGGPEYAPL